MAAIAGIKHEWRLLKQDRPGERFNNHRRRMSTKPKWQKAARAGLGITLLAIGIVFCILPGPGSLGIVLGLALLGGMSRTIARWMDRVEPRLRRGLRRAHVFWTGLSRPNKALLIAAAAIVLALGIVVVCKSWIGPMLASHAG